MEQIHGQVWIQWGYHERLYYGDTQRDIHVYVQSSYMGWGLITYLESKQNGFHNLNPYEN